MKKRNLAIVAPDMPVRSETFIEAQRTRIDAHVSYYYKGTPPQMLDGRFLYDKNLLRTAWIELKRRLGMTPLTSILEVPVAASFAHEGIDVVLAQFGSTGTGLMNICKLLKLPLIVHFHGYDASRHEVLSTYREAYKAMFDYASYIIAVSRSMERRLIDIGAPAHKVVYNPYGPHDDFFDLQPTFAKKLFVAAGRFTDKKAPYYTILAFEQVLRSHPDARLVIAGTGELWDVCHNLVNYEGLDGKVLLPGAYTPGELKEWFTEATAFVQHSITPSSGDMEGTPVVILEAGAAGLPVIATRHAGIPDVIVEGETGLLVNEHDVEGMARCMCRLLDDPALARQMGLAGRENMRAHYSMQRHIGVLNKLVYSC